MKIGRHAATMDGGNIAEEEMKKRRPEAEPSRARRRERQG